MNVNTVAFAPRLPGAVQGVSSSAEFEFKNADGGNAEFTVPAGWLNKRRFRITACGRFTGEAAATTLTVIIHAGTALGTDLFSSGAKTITGVSGSFVVTVEGSVDSTSDIITGMGYGSVGATVITPAIAQAASQDPETALTFSVSGTMSTSHADNKAYLDSFTLELL